jgi:hypothetical protein
MILYSSYRHVPLFEDKIYIRTRKLCMLAAFLYGILQVSIRIASNYTKKVREKNRTIYHITSTLKSSGEKANNSIKRRIFITVHPVLSNKIM